jgi:hypothetical protein
MKLDTIRKTRTVKFFFKALRHTTALTCQYANNVHIIRFNLSSYKGCMCPLKKLEVKRYKIRLLAIVLYRYAALSVTRWEVEIVLRILNLREIN